MAVIGAGSMGGSILAGLTHPGVDVASLSVTVRSSRSAEPLRASGLTVFALDEDPNANRRAVAGAQIVVVAVKPAMIPGVLREVADALLPGAVVVSVAAGLTTSSMEAIVPGSVIRAMPNTPALIGASMTGIAAGARASNADLDLARRVFGTMGEVLVIEESRLDALTAISGSGPAYVFHAVEKWMDVARGLGFTDEEARLLVGQTFLGAGRLLAETGEDPAELRRRVTSPGGTTAAAIAVLDDAGLERIYRSAADAAIARAKEIGAPSAGFDRLNPRKVGG